MIKQRVFSMAVAIITAGGGISFASAQDTGVPPPPPPPFSERARVSDEQRATVDQQRNEARTRVETQRAEVQMRREERRVDMRQRGESRQMTTESRSEARDRFEEKRQEVQRHRDEMRQQVEARRDELRDRWEARKAKLSEMHKQIIKNHIERIIKRMQAAVERLTRLADKVDERIGIIVSDGADVSDATSLMTNARSAIARAQTELDEAVADFRAAPETDNPAEGVGNARARFENVKAALREAHAALVEVIKSLKGRSVTTPNTQDANKEPAGNE